MSYDGLNIFRQVAADGSFTKAAENLNRPKSSISTAVSRLEAYLGLRLLERTTRRIRLTDAGTNLYNESAEHLNALHDLMLSAQTHSQSISGTLRLAAPYEFGAHHFASIAARLMAEHTDLRIILDVYSSDPKTRKRNVPVIHFEFRREVSQNSGFPVGRVSNTGRRIFSIQITTSCFR